MTFNLNYVRAPLLGQSRLLSRIFQKFGLSKLLCKILNSLVEEFF